MTLGSSKGRSGGLQRKAPLRSASPKSKGGSSLKTSKPLQSGGGLKRKTPLQDGGGGLKRSGFSNGRKPGADATKASGATSGRPPTGSELKRSAPPQRSSGIKRAPLARTASDTPRGGAVQGSTPKVRTPIARKPMKATRASISPEEKSCRAVVTERSQGICEKCGTGGPLEKAHRIGRGVGGKWTPANILDLCHNCHHGNHAHPTEAYDAGQHLRSTSDPTQSKVLFRNGGRYDWALLADDGSWRWVES